MNNEQNKQISPSHSPLSRETTDALRSGAPHPPLYNREELLDNSVEEEELSTGMPKHEINKQRLEKINAMSPEEWKTQYVDVAPQTAVDTAKFLLPADQKLHIFLAVEKQKVMSFKQEQANNKLYKDQKYGECADEGNMPIYTEDGRQWTKRGVARDTQKRLYGEDSNGKYGLIIPDDIDEHILEEEGASINTGSPVELFEAGTRFLLNTGMDVRVTGDELLANLSFYRQVKPRQLKGLDVPEDFNHWQAMGRNSNEMSKLTKVFQLMPKHIYKFWGAVLTGSGSSSSALGRVSYLFEDLRDLGVTLTGHTQNHKFIPPLEWFPKELTDHSPEELLTILPHAEANTLLHVLGRVACQESDKQLAEGSFSTKNRCAVLLAGEPNCGKSSLLEYFTEALAYGGYESSLMPLSFNQFGWEQIARTDLAYLDDLNSNSVMEIFNNNQLKPIISNGMVSTEKKGVDKVDMRSKAVLFAITNEVRIPKNADSGNLNRWHVLQCHSLTKLEGEEDLRTWQYWNRLAMTLDIDPLLIPLYLIRRGIDYHLDANGVKIENRQIKQDILSIRATETLEVNRQRYLYQYPVNMQKELLRGHSRAVTLQCFLDKDYDQRHDDKGSFHAGSLFLYFRTMAELSARHKELTESLRTNSDEDIKEVTDEQLAAIKKLLDWLMPDGLFSMDNVITQFSALNKAIQKECVGNDTIWSNAIKCVSSQIGVRPIERREYYNDQFKIEIENRQQYNQELLQIMQSMPTFVKADIAQKVKCIQPKL